MNKIIERTQKRTGEKVLGYNLDVRSPAGTACIVIIAYYYRGRYSISVGIQGTSEGNWDVPSGYQFLSEGVDISRASYKTHGTCNHRHYWVEENTTEKTADLVTPYGTVKITARADYTHRKQYLEVETSEIPNEVQISVG